MTDKWQNLNNSEESVSDLLEISFLQLPRGIEKSTKTTVRRACSAANI
jgi:hypothetical protein